MILFLIVILFFVFLLKSTFSVLHGAISLVKLYNMYRYNNNIIINYYLLLFTIIIIVIIYIYPININIPSTYIGCITH